MKFSFQFCLTFGYKDYTLKTGSFSYSEIILDSFIQTANR